MRPPPATGVVGWILAKQALFYRALSGLIRAAKTDGSAYWGLMGISFIYGIFHAAGPGHGKAVISSYLLANEETWRRGIALSFASALLQALTAVVLVAIAAVLIGATAKMMGDTVRVIEIVSYALIMLLGARLFWVKGRGFLHALHALRSEPQPSRRTRSSAAIDHVQHDHDAPCRHHDHAHDNHTTITDTGTTINTTTITDHDHDHEEDTSCRGATRMGPSRRNWPEPGGWRRGLSAIVAVGLRPCSGAIIVLVFALAQGLFWAGSPRPSSWASAPPSPSRRSPRSLSAPKPRQSGSPRTRAGYGTLAAARRRGRRALSS